MFRDKKNVTESELKKEMRCPECYKANFDIDPIVRTKQAKHARNSSRSSVSSSGKSDSSEPEGALQVEKEIELKKAEVQARQSEFRLQKFAQKMHHFEMKVEE